MQILQQLDFSTSNVGNLLSGFVEDPKQPVDKNAGVIKIGIIRNGTIPFLNKFFIIHLLKNTN